MYQGVFQTILVLAVYGWGLAFPEHHTQAEIHADALTMAFATLGLIQLLHAFNVKSVYQSVFKLVSLEIKLSTGQFQWPSFF